MSLKAFKTRFALLKAILFPGFNPITPVFKSRVAYPEPSCKLQYALTRLYALLYFSILTCTMLEVTKAMLCCYNRLCTGSCKSEERVIQANFNNSFHRHALLLIEELELPRNTWNAAMLQNLPLLVLTRHTVYIHMSSPKSRHFALHLLALQFDLLSYSNCWCNFQVYSSLSPHLTALIWNAVLTEVEGLCDSNSPFVLVLHKRSYPLLKLHKLNTYPFHYVLETDSDFLPHETIEFSN